MKWSVIGGITGAAAIQSYVQRGILSVPMAH